MCAKPKPTGGNEKNCPSPNANSKSKRNYNNRGGKPYMKDYGSGAKKTGIPDEFADKRARWKYVAERARKNSALGANDPSWYNKLGQLSKNYANFNFATPVGSKLQYNIEQYPSVDSDRDPGVMALYFCPTFGDTEDGNASSLNLAADRLYQFARFENNGSSVYDRGDLMLYFLAMDSCYMFRSYLVRLYGLMSTYSTMNRYWPRALVKANRANFESLRANLADFRAFINQYTAKLQMLPIPADLAYIKRHMWMAENVFVDEDTIKNQFYMFVPFYFNKFRYAGYTPTTCALDSTERVSSTPGDPGVPYLTYERPSYADPDGMSLSELMNFGYGLLDALVREEDFNLIGSDIVKAWGTNGLFKVDMIEDGYKTLPIFSPEVLDQIENATVIGNPACVDINGAALNYGASIYWDDVTNTLIPNKYFWVPFDNTQTWQIPYRPFMGNRLINFEKDVPNQDDIMVATRLTLGVSGVHQTTEGNAFELKGVGSEVINSMVIFYFTDLGTAGFRLGQTYPIYFVFPIVNSSTDLDSAYAAMQAGAVPGTIEAKVYGFTRPDKIRIARELCYLTRFNRHPAVMTLDIDQYIKVDYVDGQITPSVQGLGPLAIESIKRFGDTSVYAFFSVDDLVNLHSVAMQSEFYVPLSAGGPIT